MFHTYKTDQILQLNYPDNYHVYVNRPLSVWRRIEIYSWYNWSTVHIFLKFGEQFTYIEERGLVLKTEVTVRLSLMYSCWERHSEGDRDSKHWILLMFWPRLFCEWKCFHKLHWNSFVEQGHSFTILLCK